MGPILSNITIWLFANGHYDGKKRLKDQAVMDIFLHRIGSPKYEGSRKDFIRKMYREESHEAFKIDYLEKLLTKKK